MSGYHKMRKNLYNSCSLSDTGLTQGTIITNCVAEGCNSSKVWGVIITPRCDLAHLGKVNTVHYLPMLNVADWLNNIGKAELEEEWMKVVKNDINNAMKQWGIEADFLSMKIQYQDLLAICEAKERSNSKKELFKKNCNSYFYKDKILFKEFINSKSAKKYVKDLVGGNNNRYYLLEDWNDSSNFKVIILRDIRRINIDIARKFVCGFDYTEHGEDVFKQNDLNYDSLESCFDGLYYIENQIQSPYIEHILQRFSYNFTRVGVNDMDSHSLDLFMHILKQTLA